MKLIETRTTVFERAVGLCEKCGQNPATVVHHRRPRGMGGTRDKYQHSPANLLALDDDCHRWVESNSSESYEFGWKIPHNTLAPVDAPVLRRGEWRFLDHEGGIFEAAPIDNQTPA